MKLELQKPCITKKVILFHGSLRATVLKYRYNLAAAIEEHCAFGYTVLTPLKYIPTSMLPSTEMPFLFNTSAKFIFFFSLSCYLWLPWVFIAACVLSLVVLNGSYSLVAKHILFSADRLSSCGTGLSCPVACGIFLDLGSNL